MSICPLLAIALGVLGLAHVLDIEVWASFSIYVRMHRWLPVMDGLALLAAPLISIAAGLVVIGKRHSLAAWIAGPSETEQLRVKPRALLSAGLAVLGVALVLDSILVVVGVTTMLQYSGPAGTDSIMSTMTIAAIAPSIRMAFGVIWPSGVASGPSAGCTPSGRVLRGKLLSFSIIRERDQ